MRSRELIIVVVTSVLLGLTGVASSLALGHERDRAERAADARAAQAAAAVGYAVASSVDRLEGLRDLFASSTAVTEREFERFGRGMLEDRVLHSVSFTARVRAGARAAYEARHGFPVLDPSLRRARTRPVYHPITYVAGLERGGSLGVDVGLDPARSRTLAAAAAADDPRATGIVLLGAHGRGFVVYLPVRDVRRDVTGFVAATFELDRLLAAVAPALPPEANVRLWDAETTGPAVGPGDRVRTIDVASRTWRVAVDAPAEPELAFPVGLAVSGLLLTLLVVVVLLEMRRHATGAIRRSDETESQFRLLAENATDVIARQTPDGTLFYVSPAARSVIGYEPEELVGRPWQSLVHPDDLGPDGTPLNAIVEAPDVHTYTFRLRRSDGQWVWVETTVRRLRDAETGELEEIQASTRDITARMMAEERVRRSEAFFRSAFEDALVPMCLTAPNGAVLRVNRRLCELLGRTERQLVGSSFASLTHPDDAALSLEQVRGAIVGDSEGIRMEKRYIHADGSTVWVELTSTLVRDGSGRPLYFVTQMVDIGDRRRAELALENALASEREQVEALRELHRLQDEFVSLVSHELRTPLTSIDGYIELALEEGDKVDAEVRGFLETAHRNSARLRRLVEDLLVLHRADAGKLEVARVSLDLLRVVREAAGAAAPAAARQGVEVIVEPCDEPLPVLGDADRLGQVLDNLLSNAVKFTPGGGRVRVRLTREDGSARIAVSDTGIGIPAAELGRLSERFFRTSTAAAHAIQGTGLGLAITKTMVEMHGGSLSVESEEGRGSTFAVTLPLAA